MGAPRVVAHRGLTTRATENTVEAFRDAVAAGADGVEFDVRRTADGVLVVHHDATVGRLTIRRSAHRDVVGAGRDRGYEIPTLAEVLEDFAGRADVDVEVKEDGHERQVYDVATATCPVERLVVTSFHGQSLERFRALDPHLALGLLVGPVRQVVRRLPRASHPASAARALRHGASVLAPHWRLARTGALGAAADAGLGAWVWTVNSSTLLRRFLADPRVDAVITDEPGLALALRDAPRAG